ncbi:MAG: lipid IV(A) 3-deoxy-D-manno-octulosonic acid transferase [Epsilonproteobacteria bacterium]|nr:lipid IV(A) 3-deoxy-D-manno-octulosonic acid transferase [Campylobacterota bacterium]
MFKYFYFLLSFFLYLLAIPYLLIKSRTNKYKIAIPAKFFLKNNPPFKENKIWFHSCSMGETRALKPILEQFSKDDINLSVITNTGFEEAKKMVDNVRYLPFEIFLPFWIRKQKMLLVMEAELWYMLFLVASQKGARTVLINARINDKSYLTYKKYRFFYKHIFKHIDKIFAQSQIDKERLIELGGKDIEVIGNIKLASLPKVTKNYQKQDGILITAGSTHKGEEELILNSWNRKQGRLVIVPRHPERFDDVWELIKSKYGKSDLNLQRFSQKDDLYGDIILVDKMGELNNIYSISDVVILGGGFIKSAGGHNPIEPAFFGCKLLSGKVIFNQKSLFECVENYNLIDESELKDYLDKIDTLKRSSIGQSGDITPIIEMIRKENGQR